MPGYKGTGGHVWQLELYKCLFKGQVTSDVEVELAGYGDGGEGMIRKRRHAMYGVIDHVIEKPLNLCTDGNRASAEVSTVLRDKITQLK
ncbi:hypothetical protein PV325_012359 [Microctonus aethiopoides]|nr:hypothetical protein PV325_012359 [Microctonus aethiopoides]